MAEEEKQEETTEETPEAPEAEAPEAAEPQAEAPAEDAPAEEEAPPEEAPAEDDPAEEAAPEDAPAEEEAAPAGDAPAAEADEPQAELGPKQKRKLARSTHSGEARDPRSPEQRASDRAERRRQKSAARVRARASVRRRRGSERGTGTPAAEREPGSRKVRQGTVVSAKPDKTITVRVEITHRHPTYEKVVRQSNTVHAHDERNEAGEGDVVRVVESRPLSRLKRWRLVEIVEKAR